MNNDLISREVLKKHKVYVEERHEYVVPVYNIDNAPTIDINTELSVAYLKGRRQGQSEGRPQGEWIVSEYIDTCRGYVAKCSFCKEDTVGGGAFCPNCGAKMGKEKNDETTDN